VYIENLSLLIIIKNYLQRLRYQPI